MQIFNNSRTTKDFGLILIAFFLSLSFTLMMGSRLYNVKIILITLLAVLLGSIVLNQNLFRNLIMSACIGLVIGWRSIHFFSYQIYFFPAELIIWIGFAADLGGIVSRENTQYFSHLPRSALLLALFTLIGLVVAGIHHATLLENAIDEAKSFIIFIPLIILLQRWVRSIADISRLARTLIVAGFLIAVSGLLEYFVPSVAKLAANLLHQKSIEYYRANFQGSELVRLSPYYFWGGASVVAVALVPLVGLLTAVVGQTKSLRKWFWACMSIILVGGIIVSGYRSAWLGLLITVFVMLFLDRKYIWAVLLTGIPFIRFLPIGFIERFNTILNINKASDTSLITRTAKIHIGIKSVIDHPLWGTGWASPAVYNDWLYLTVALGLPALIILATWYGRLLVQLFNIFYNSTDSVRRQERLLAAGFLIGLSGNAVCMISGAMVQVRPLITSFWIIFCLAWRFVELAGPIVTSTQMEEIQIG